VYVDRAFYNYRIRPGSLVQGHFSVDHLSILKCADNMIAYTGECYPDLQVMARWRKIEGTMDIMLKIAGDSCMSQHRETYEMLEKLLYTELESLHGEDYFQFRRNCRHATRLRLRMRLAKLHPALLRVYAKITVIIKRIVYKWVYFK
jgi:hypothetical protein